jgi:hypothetical protein
LREHHDALERMNQFFNPKGRDPEREVERKPQRKLEREVERRPQREVEREVERKPQRKLEREVEREVDSNYWPSGSNIPDFLRSTFFQRPLPPPPHSGNVSSPIPQIF